MTTLLARLRGAGVSRWRRRRYQRPWVVSIGATAGLPDAWVEVDADARGVCIRMPAAVSADGVVATGMRAQLDALFDARPERPLDAIVVRIPAALFIAEPTAAGARLSAGLGVALALIRDRTGMRAPVYVVIDDCRAGWPQFETLRPLADPGGLFGWSAPVLIETGVDPEWPNIIFGSLGADARRIGADGFADALEPPDAASAPWALWLVSLFPASPDAPPPWFRGVYLVDDDLFSKDLFTQKIWPESGIAVAEGRAAEAIADRRTLGRKAKSLLALIALVLAAIGALAAFSIYTATRDVALADAAQACTDADAARALRSDPDGALLTGLTASPLPFDVPVPLALRFWVPDGAAACGRLRAGVDALLPPLATDLDARMRRSLAAPALSDRCVPPRVLAPADSATYAQLGTRAALLGDRDRYRAMGAATDFTGLAALVAPAEIEVASTAGLAALYDDPPDAPALADDAALRAAIIDGVNATIAASYEKNRLLLDLEALRAPPTDPKALRCFAAALSRSALDLAEPNAAWPLAAPELETPMALIATLVDAGIASAQIEPLIERWQQAQFELAWRVASLRSPSEDGPSVLAKEGFALTDRLTALVEPLDAFYAEPLLVFEQACEDPVSLDCLSDSDTCNDDRTACGGAPLGDCAPDPVTCDAATLAVAEAPSLTEDLEKAVALWPELQTVGRRAIQNAAVSAASLRTDAASGDAKVQESLDLIALIESLLLTDPDRAKALRAQLTNKALARLRSAERGLQGAYSPARTWTKTWLGATPQTQAMFDAKTDDALADWLAEQAIRVERAAEAVEAELVLIDGLGEPGTTDAAFIFWTATKAADATLLDAFITDVLAIALPGACPTDVDIEVPDGADLYAQRHRMLIDASQSACLTADYAVVRAAFDAEPRAFVDGAPNNPAAIQTVFAALETFQARQADHAPVDSTDCGWRFIDALSESQPFFAPLGAPEPTWQIEVTLRAESGPTPIADRAMEIGDARVSLFDAAHVIAWQPGMPIGVSLRWAESTSRVPSQASGAELIARTVRWVWSDRWVLWRLIESQAVPTDADEPGIVVEWTADDMRANALDPQPRTVTARMRLLITDPASKSVLPRSPRIPSAVTPEGRAPESLTGVCSTL